MLILGVPRACYCLRLPHSRQKPLLLRWRRRPPRLPPAHRRGLSTVKCFLSNSDDKPKAIVISGPTGAGKSRLALELAKRLNGEIISADSVQVYRGLDVGSAKPSRSDRQKVPHHLVDIMHPSEDYSVGQFFEDARQATKDIISRGRVPIVSGGTGLYLRWYVYGKPDVPKASPEITSEVCAELADFQRIGDWSSAVQLVVKAGDSKAQSLAANDWYRLRRSLEIIKSTGSPPSAFQMPYDSFKESYHSTAEFGSPESRTSTVVEEFSSKQLDYNFICFFLSSPRLDLYRCIDLRCEDMLLGQDSILSEAQWLLQQGLLPNSNSATRAIGYRQAMEYLLWCREQGGRSSPADFFSFLSEFQKASRNFAKRQLTWFRNEPLYYWLNASNPMEKVLNFIYDAYHHQTGDFDVPQSLRIDKDMTNRRETSALKSYRAKNRHFVDRGHCSDILEWISRIQSERGIPL